MAERIVEKKIYRHKVFSEEERSWEPEERCRCDLLIAQFHQRNNLRSRRKRLARSKPNKEEKQHEALKEILTGINNIPEKLTISIHDSLSDASYELNLVDVSDKLEEKEAACEFRIEKQRQDGV